MSELYQVKPYEDMTDGELVLAYGIHVVHWDFARFGVPHYGIVPAGSDTEPEIAALDALRAELAAARADAERLAGVVDTLLAFVHHGIVCPVEMGYPLSKCDCAVGEIVIKANAALASHQRGEG